MLWYGSRLREHYSLFLNVVSILFFNFNLNHLHTRYTPRTLFELRLLQGFHRGIDAFVRGYARVLLGARAPHRQAEPARGAARDRHRLIALDADREAQRRDGDAPEVEADHACITPSAPMRVSLAQPRRKRTPR